MVIWMESIMPWGNRQRVIFMVMTLPFQFAGQLGIQSSGNDLLYMRNRFYAMETGRFIAEDPIELADGDINFYRYVGNDPVN